MRTAQPTQSSPRRKPGPRLAPRDGSRGERLRKNRRGGNGLSMPRTKYATSAASLLPSVSSSATCSDSYESRMAPGSNTIGTGFRRENEHLLSERNQLLRERNEPQRRLDGARANISRLQEQRVQELFPDGPGRG